MKMKRCKIEGCGERAHARGWCQKHYRSWYNHGDPLTIKQHQRHGLSLAERYWTYTKKGRGCWEWVGYRDPNGYGRLNVDGIPVLAHRVAWEVLNGPITADQHVLHRCDNPCCVRPEHLFLGDQIANNADKMAKKRHRYGVSRGSAHGCAKLTEEQVLAIRESVGPSRIIGEEFGVSGRQVRDIRARRVWRHIP